MKAGVDHSSQLGKHRVDNAKVTDDKIERSASQCMILVDGTYLCDLDCGDFLLLHLLLNLHTHDLIIYRLGRLGQSLLTAGPSMPVSSNPSLSLYLQPFIANRAMTSREHNVHSLRFEGRDVLGQGNPQIEL